MSERLKMYTEVISQSKKHIPGPVHSLQEKSQTTNIGLNERSFGHGNKINFSRPANNNPGPIYNIARFYMAKKRIK